MRIADLMTHPVTTVRPELSADDAWDTMRRQQIHHLIVGANGDPMGVVSARDLSTIAARRGRTVADLMHSTVISVPPDATLKRAASLLRGHSIGCLPVVEKGRVVGIVTVSDLLELLVSGSFVRTTIDDRDGRRRRQREFPFGNRAAQR
jgi:CBS domain-containing protein